MTWWLLTPELVEAIHDAVLNPGELPGRARDKSLEGALARVDNRLAYGMIVDVFDLAAAYAEAVARGHCFNDGNKRTAFRSMHVCLDLNGVTVPWTMDDTGELFVALARGALDDAGLAAWLRARAG